MSAGSGAGDPRVFHLRLATAFSNRVCESVVVFHLHSATRLQIVAGFRSFPANARADRSCVSVCGCGDCQDQGQRQKPKQHRKQKQRQRPQVPRPKTGREDLSYKGWLAPGRRPELQNRCRRARRYKLQPGFDQAGFVAGVFASLARQAPVSRRFCSSGLPAPGAISAGSGAGDPRVFQLRSATVFGNRVCKSVAGFSFCVRQPVCESMRVSVRGRGDCQDQGQKPQVPSRLRRAEDLSYKNFRLRLR